MPLMVVVAAVVKLTSRGPLIEKERRYGYFFRTLKESALPNMVRLQQACRRGGIEVTYTVIESLTADGRDR